jgi:NADP-dependent 3-hydroxy acid dehydrogenase YdfG
VTGGASGIDASISRHVVCSGGSVAILDVDTDAARSFPDERGPSGFVADGNVLDERLLTETNDAIAGSLSSITALVNRAGTAQV